MQKAFKTKLKSILKESFEGSFEKGGGKEHRFFHGMRVARFSEIIARKEKLKVDHDALFVAALFHDIGKIKAVVESGEIDYKSEGNKNHHLVSEQMFLEVLGKDAFDLLGKEFINKVISIIQETHIDLPTLLEVKAIQDADELDNFGYLQIWRTFTYDALANMSFSDALEWWKIEGKASRLKTLKSLWFETTKRIANNGFMRTNDFFVKLYKENSGIFN
ncbi:HD domain-containing protein [Candidatus Amesbacteria bacterium]|nr:HD domain-containing protein [Candidatus Amesbacteria bacterium]